MRTINIREMYDCNVHLGTRMQKVNPKMRPFLMGTYEGTAIINILKTYTRIFKIKIFLKRVVSVYGYERVLFVGTNRIIAPVIAEMAEKSSSSYINERWKGGFLTNFNYMIKNKNFLFESNQNEKEKEVIPQTLSDSKTEVKNKEKEVIPQTLSDSKIEVKNKEKEVIPQTLSDSKIEVKSETLSQKKKISRPILEKISDLSNRKQKFNDQPKTKEKEEHPQLNDEKKKNVSVSFSNQEEKERKEEKEKKKEEKTSPLESQVSQEVKTPITILDSNQTQIPTLKPRPKIVSSFQEKTNTNDNKNLALASGSEKQLMNRPFNKFNTLPHIVIIVGQQKEMKVVKECKKLNILTITLLDTDGDPSLTNLFIPGNDDHPGSVECILKHLGESIATGKILYKEKQISEMESESSYEEFKKKNVKKKPKFNSEKKPKFNSKKPKFNSEKKPKFNSEKKPKFNSKKPKFNSEKKEILNKQ